MHTPVIILDRMPYEGSMQGRLSLNLLSMFVTLHTQFVYVYFLFLLCFQLPKNAAIYIDGLPLDIQFPELQICFHEMGEITAIQSFGHGHAIVVNTFITP